MQNGALDLPLKHTAPPYPPLRTVSQLGHWTFLPVAYMPVLEFSLTPLFFLHPAQKTDNPHQNILLALSSQYTLDFST